MSPQDELFQEIEKRRKQVMNPRESKPELLAQNERVEVYAVPGRYGERPGIMVHDTVYPDQRARMAAAFVERWALAAAETDGEDSAGRQKLRTLTASELAKKACDAVDALYEEFSARNWILPAVSWAQVEEAMKAPPQPMRQSQEQIQGEQPTPDTTN